MGSKFYLDVCFSFSISLTKVVVGHDKSVNKQNFLNELFSIILSMFCLCHYIHEYFLAKTLYVYAINFWNWNYNFVCISPYTYTSCNEEVYSLWDPLLGTLYPQDTWTYSLFLLMCPCIQFWKCMICTLISYSHWLIRGWDQLKCHRRWHRAHSSLLTSIIILCIFV